MLPVFVFLITIPLGLRRFHSGMTLSHEEKLCSLPRLLSSMYFSSVIFNSDIEQSKPLASMITLHANIFPAERTLSRNDSSERSFSNKSFDCAIVISMWVVAIVSRVAGLVPVSCSETATPCCFFAFELPVRIVFFCCPVRIFLSSTVSRVH